jgi:homoserine dehydrogenase
MKNFRLALIGIGNVNQGLVEILRDQKKFLADTFDVEFTVVGISDLLKGNVYSPDGLDLNQILTCVNEGGTLDRVDGAEKGWDASALIANSNADIVVEASYTNLETAEPAVSYVRSALKNGKHVVTSNKGPVALYYHELSKLAQEKNLHLGVEGTVMSGTPAIYLGREILKSAKISKIEGILNGTTNFILTKMEEGMSYQNALEDAQKLGYAEADPTGDVEGFDAAGKVVILAQLLFDRPIKMDDVERTGISKLTLVDIKEAKQAGERWKLIGSLQTIEGELHARVAPIRLPISHPLANVNGATNAIAYDTEILGKVTLIGPGAGRKETGFALLSDMLSIHKSLIRK